MLKSRFVLLSTSFAALFSLAQCGGGSSTPSGTGGSNGAGTGGTNGVGSGGANASGGSSGTATGGAVGTASGGSNGVGSGGSTSSGGSGAGTGGRANTGGSGTATGGSGTATGGSGGGANTGGATGSGGAATGGAGPRVDMGGIPLAKPGDMTNVSRKYLNLGEMRLINNRWGSDELGCAGTVQRVFIGTDKTLSWEFNRPACGGAKAKPDYPEIEFGVAPFGANNSLLTTPAFSSTTLLPKQVKDLTSASITVDTLQISLQKPTIWNSNFEIWLSQKNPLTDPNPGVYAEIIAFWGWENGRWPCDKSGNLANAGSHSYHMCHQSDTWADGKWRFYNFNVDNGPLTTYNGTVNVKAFIDYVVKTYGISTELWLTRMEVGSEIDDNTQGSVKIKNITFEVNGTSKKPEFGM
jgi:hypothetical protein